MKSLKTPYKKTIKNGDGELIIENRLTIESQVENSWKKAEQTLHGLARIANDMDISKKYSIINTFIFAQFLLPDNIDV